METIILKWENEEGSIRKWQISKNREVTKNQPVAACVINKKVQTLYSPSDGRVERIYIPEGGNFQAGYD
jgi:pyruvate/2-oxoglutarate dehydrogenase complex dihydrolipoamide acyltransferase (E2) component